MLRKLISVFSQGYVGNSEAELAVSLRGWVSLHKALGNPLTKPNAVRILIHLVRQIKDPLTEDDEDGLLLCLPHLPQEKHLDLLKGLSRLETPETPEYFKLIATALRFGLPDNTEIQLTPHLKKRVIGRLNLLFQKLLNHIDGWKVYQLYQTSQQALLAFCYLLDRLLTLETPQNRQCLVNSIKPILQSLEGKTDPILKMLGETALRAIDQLQPEDRSMAMIRDRVVPVADGTLHVVSGFVNFFDWGLIRQGGILIAEGITARSSQVYRPISELLSQNLQHVTDVQECKQVIWGLALIAEKEGCSDENRQQIKEKFRRLFCLKFMTGVGKSLGDVAAIRELILAIIEKWLAGSPALSALAETWKTEVSSHFRAKEGSSRGRKLLEKWERSNYTLYSTGATIFTSTEFQGDLWIKGQQHYQSEYEAEMRRQEEENSRAKASANDLIDPSYAPPQGESSVSTPSTIPSSTRDDTEDLLPFQEFISHVKALADEIKGNANLAHIQTHLDWLDKHVGAPTTGIPSPIIIVEDWLDAVDYIITKTQFPPDLQNKIANGVLPYLLWTLQINIEHLKSSPKSKRGASEGIRQLPPQISSLPSRHSERIYEGCLSLKNSKTPSLLTQEVVQTIGKCGDGLLTNGAFDHVLNHIQEGALGGAETYVLQLLLTNAFCARLELRFGNRNYLKAAARLLEEPATQLSDEPGSFSDECSAFIAADPFLSKVDLFLEKAFQRRDVIQMSVILTPLEQSQHPLLQAYARSVKSYLQELPSDTTHTTFGTLLRDVSMSSHFDDDPDMRVLLFQRGITTDFPPGSIVPVRLMQQQLDNMQPSSPFSLRELIIESLLRTCYAQQDLSQDQPLSEDSDVRPITARAYIQLGKLYLEQSQQIEQGQLEGDADFLRKEAQRTLQLGLRYQVDHEFFGLSDYDQQALIDLDQLLFGSYRAPLLEAVNRVSRPFQDGDDQNPDVVIIEGVYCGKRVIDNPDEIAKLFQDDPEHPGQKRFLRANTSGRSDVTILGEFEHRIHVKNNPSAPGVEVGMGMLFQTMVGGGITPVDLVKLHYHGNTYVTQFSKTVSGMTLSAFIKKEASPMQRPEFDRILSQINLDSFGAMVVMSFMINPEGWSGANFILVPVIDASTTPPTILEWQIVGINNDHMLVGDEPPTTLEGDNDGDGEDGGAISSPAAEEPSDPTPLPDNARVLIKNILYLLPQMNEQISDDLRNLLLSDAFNPVERIMMMLWGVVGFNQRVQWNAQERQDLYESYGDNGTGIKGVLPPMSMARMYRKYIKLRDALRKNPNLTYAELLEIMDPILHAIYQDASHESRPTLHSQIQYLFNPVEERTSLTTTKDIFRLMFHRNIITLSDLENDDNLPERSMLALEGGLNEAEEAYRLIFSAMCQRLLREFPGLPTSVKESLLKVSCFDRELSPYSKTFTEKIHKALTSNIKWDQFTDLAILFNHYLITKVLAKTFPLSHRLQVLPIYHLTEGYGIVPKLNIFEDIARCVHLSLLREFAASSNLLKFLKYR